MTKTHENFKSALLDSREPVVSVAEWLVTQGHDVKILENTVSPTLEERFEHMDDGDIEVRLRVEVKGRGSLDFDSVASFPFPTVIVDEAYKIAKVHPKKLFGYAIVNKTKTGLLWIPASTKKHWVTTTKRDSKEGMDKKFVECPKEYTTYRPMPGGAA